MILSLFLHYVIPVFISLEPEFHDKTVPLHCPGNELVKECIKEVELINFMISDTVKTTDTSIVKGKYYVIAGSFLIPKNAENQVAILQKMGFNKSFKYNFPESEFYSVVIDTFQVSFDYLELTEKLQKNKIDYFIKNY